MHGSLLLTMTRLSSLLTVNGDFETIAYTGALLLFLLFRTEIQSLVFALWKNRNAPTARRSDIVVAAKENVTTTQTLVKTPVIARTASYRSLLSPTSCRQRRSSVKFASSVTAADLTQTSCDDDDDSIGAGIIRNKQSSVDSAIKEEPCIKDEEDEKVVDDTHADTPIPPAADTTSETRSLEPRSPLDPLLDTPQIPPQPRSLPRARSAVILDFDGSKNTRRHRRTSLSSETPTAIALDTLSAISLQVKKKLQRQSSGSTRSMHGFDYRGRLNLDDDSRRRNSGASNNSGTNAKGSLKC
jgi:hypothetical protein